MSAETAAQWVPIALSADVLEGTVIPAKLPSGPIAVWRSGSGDIYANGDRCPHRGMRLSHGFVRGETLSCIYHGWRFGTDGACQKIPAHPAIDPPKSINCGALPTIEVYGVVWAASQTPPDAPPDFIGYEALRSLVINATAEAITQTCKGELIAGATKTRLDQQDVLLLMNAVGPDEVFVIVLIRSGLSVPDRLAVSAAMEALRRAVEDTERAA